METHIRITHKLARELAEMTVYMKWWFEMDHRDDPSDPYHSYAIVQAYSGANTEEDFRIELAALCPEELDEMWTDLRRLMRYYVHTITTEQNTHK
jgi:hypothetical protein